MNHYSRLLLLSALCLSACSGPVRTDESAAPADPAAAADAVERTATQRALEEVSAAYSELAALVDRNPGEAVEWAQADLENLGDWEYRIVESANASPEALEAELNALGDQRWEVYWVESSRDGVRLYLKRPSISYLSRVPLSSLVRMLAGGTQ